MFNSSLQIGTIFGIPIKLHFSLVIVFFLISWTLAYGFMPEYSPGLTENEYWIMSIIGTIILFLSVLIHELSHSVVAKSYGIRVRQIVLFVFGGVSDIEEEPKDFRKEFKMAFAGPGMSFVLSGVFALLWWITITISISTDVANNELSNTLLTMTIGIFFYSSFLNLILGIFNLFPAFPMDGGRILRSILFRRNNDYDKSTRISVRIGIIISYAFFGLGILIILSGSFVSGIWIILIGWFLQNGAQSYIYQYDLMKILSIIKLEQIMNPNVITVRDDMNIEYILRGYFNIYMKSAFPVLDVKEHFVGLVSLGNCLDVPESNRHTTNVNDIMIKRNEITLLNIKDTAEKALTTMVKKKQDKIFVGDLNDNIIGVVSKSDILEAMDEKKYFLTNKTNKKIGF